MKRKWLCKATIFTLSLGFLLIPAHAQSSQDWWFDVEIILFKRVLDTQIDEDFSDAATDFDVSAQRDLISLSLLNRADNLMGVRRALPSCVEEDDITATVSGTDLFSGTAVSSALNGQTALDKHPLNALFDGFVFNTKLSCVHHELPRFPTKVPLQFTNESAYVIGSEQVVSADDLRLTEFAKNLFAQRNIKPLLHTVWRQNIIFGEKKAKFFNLKAGEKLTLPKANLYIEKEETDAITTFKHSDSFSLVLKQIKTDIDNQTTRDWNEKKSDLQLSNELKSTNIIDNVFEIEGRLKVYLQYINRIPYLHIDSDILHHKLTINEAGMAQIQAFPFEQRRRIISKQIHYFDHPAFGMIVRLERYEPPKEDKPVN